MSIFTAVPDGFFQPSRFEKQQQAIEKPFQYSLKTAVIVLTMTAVAFGAMRAVVEGGVTTRQSTQAKK